MTGLNLWQTHVAQGQKFKITLPRSCPTETHSIYVSSFIDVGPAVLEP